MSDQLQDTPDFDITDFMRVDQVREHLDFAVSFHRWLSKDKNISLFRSDDALVTPDDYMNLLLEFCKIDRDKAMEQSKKIELWLKGKIAK